MSILGWDLSSRRGSISSLSTSTVSGPREIVFRRDWPNDRRRTAPFISALQDAIHDQGSPQMIVVGLGPGSYTGTRIAIAAAIGLQRTCGARLLGFPSVCAISEEKNYSVVGDAKRSSYFFARVTEAMLAGEIELFSETQLLERLSQTADSVYTSDELPNFSARVQLAFPRAELLCSLAATAAKHTMPAPLEPIYLRAPHITVPRARPR